MKPAVVDGIPTASVPETLVDLAGLLPTRELERTVARADRRNLVDLAELAEWVTWIGRGPGLATLAAILARDLGPSFTRSEFESMFVEEVRAYELGDPHMNTRRAGFELDAYWPDARVAVELDGQAYHQSWRSQENDRRRDAALAAEGIQVFRITWRQLVDGTKPTMAFLAQALAVRRERLHTDRRK